MDGAQGDRKQLASSECGGPNGASGSGHGPNWEYSWGWGSSPRSGWVMVQARLGHLLGLKRVMGLDQFPGIVMVMGSEMVVELEEEKAKQRL